MKIILFSDSHGMINNMIKAIYKNKPLDLVIHLGDCVRDAMKVMEQYHGIRFEIVRGNNDWSTDCPSEKTIEAGGKKLFITHGHNYNVKYDYQRIILRGKAAGVDAVLFGHTHMAEEVFSDGMLVFNPGSVSLPKNGCRPSYGIIEIKDDKLLPRFIWM